MPKDQDAEESLQGTLVSAWREFSEAGRRVALRTRLSKISTRRLVGMLRAERRRPRIAPSLPEPAPATPAPAASPLPEPFLPEPTGAGDAPPWLEPCPDHLLDHLADHATRPEARYDSAEAISLGFITALQLLPPRQRAALVLCDVAGYDAAEVADMLDTTRQAVRASACPGPFPERTGRLLT